MYTHIHVQLHIHIPIHTHTHITARDCTLSNDITHVIYHNDVYMTYIYIYVDMLLVTYIQQHITCVTYII